MKEEIVVTQDMIEDVQFEDIDFKINKPYLEKDTKVPSVTSNVDELTKKITLLVNKYKGTQLTDSNVNAVAALKKHFVSLRTGIEAKRKEWIKMYSDPMLNTVNAVCKDLTSLVQEGELALKNQLDEYDQRRKDQLTVILTEYIEDAVKAHNLRPEFASKIELRNKYYNKTQNEDDSIDDIEAQAIEAEKMQRDYDSAVALINAECEGTTLPPETYIQQLKYKTPMDLIMQIKMDKKKAKELYDELRAKEGTDQKVVIGEYLPDALDVALAESEKITKNEKRERVLRVRYTPAQAKLMNRFFKENKIEFEFIKED